MKVKIKGLVFVGFAAAILSANAMAEGENVVTSKSFTEATYQHKIGGGDDAGKAVIAGSTAGEEAYRPITSTYNPETFGTNPTNLVTEGAINSAIAAAADVENFVVDNLDGNATDKAPSQNAVNGALANKQNLDTGSNYVVSKNGAWQSMTSAVTTGSANTITVTSGTNGAAVVSAVTSAIDSGATGLAVAGDVYDAIAAVGSGAANTYQPKSAGDLKIGMDSGTWATMTPGDHVNITPNATRDAITVDIKTTDSALGIQNAADTSVNVPTDYAVKGYADSKVSSSASIDSNSTTTAPNESAVYNALGTKENVSNKVDTIDSNSDSTQYPSASAVYDYVQSQTGGTVIPAKGAICATHPCALVDDATGTHWRTMAAANYNGGECGDATGNCAAANPVDTGNVQP